MRYTYVPCTVRSSIFGVRTKLGFVSEMNRTESGSTVDSTGHAGNKRAQRSENQKKDEQSRCVEWYSQEEERLYIA